MSSEYNSVDPDDFQEQFGTLADFLARLDNQSNIALIADPPSLACPKPRVYIAKNKRKQRSNCNRAYCPSPDCRKGYARKHSSILQNEVALNPLQFYGTLRFNKGHEVTEKKFKAGIRKVTEALRKVKDKKKWSKSNKSIKFQYTTDFTARGIDWNLLLWTTGFRTWRTLKRHLRPIIQRYFCGRKFRIYLKPPKSQVAVVKYSFKDLIDRTGVLMPSEDWRGKRKIGGCRMPSGRKKSDIWAEVRQSWYPEKDHSEDEDEVFILRASISSEDSHPLPDTSTPYDIVGIAV